MSCFLGCSSDIQSGNIFMFSLSGQASEVEKHSPLHIYRGRQLFFGDQRDQLKAEDGCRLLVVTRHSSGKLEFALHMGWGEGVKLEKGLKVTPPHPQAIPVPQIVVFFLLVLVIQQPLLPEDMHLLSNSIGSSHCYTAEYAKVHKVFIMSNEQVK